MNLYHVIIYKSIQLPQKNFGYHLGIIAFRENMRFIDWPPWLFWCRFGSWRYFETPSGAPTCQVQLYLNIFSFFAFFDLTCLKNYDDSMADKWVVSVDIWHYLAHLLTLHILRQLALQVLNIIMVLSSAMMIWKGVALATNSESPVVVVLR